MKNEILFWMGVLPSCKVTVVGIIVTLEIELTISMSDLIELVHQRYFQSLTMALQPIH
jgi:hypothetical protein